MQFWTTYEFDGKYLRNRYRYPKSENKWSTAIFFSFSEKNELRSTYYRNLEVESYPLKLTYSENHIWAHKGCYGRKFLHALENDHVLPVHTPRAYIRRIWRPLVFGDEIWTAGPQPVLCAVRRCALCADAPFCWKMNLVGSRRLL